MNTITNTLARAAPGRVPNENIPLGFRGFARAPGDVPALRLIVESVMRTAEYGADIAEVVLQLTIEDEIRGDSGTLS